MIGRGQPGRFRPFSGPYTGRDLLRASQVRQRPGLLIRKEFQGPGRFGQQGLVLPPARRFQVRPPEVLYGFRLPPAPGAQERRRNTRICASSGSPALIRKLPDIPPFSQGGSARGLGNSLIIPPAPLEKRGVLILGL